MLKTLIYKEIADNIRNLRFIIGSLLVMVMSLVSVVILTAHYNNEVKEYNQRIVEQNDMIAKYFHVNRSSSFIMPQLPPSKFHPIVLGVNTDEMIKNYNNNPLDTLFPPFDFIIVVSILMSLLAILFSYNAISGEAEEGTLRLMLSNRLPRMLLLTGKWIGGMVCIFIPFILSILLISTYINLSSVIQWTGYHWLCFVLLCGASLLFISIFYLIGLTISCTVKNSTLSMLLSLFVWVILILVIPNVSPYVAAQFYKVPSVNKIEKEMARINGVERDDLLNERTKDLANQYRTQYVNTIDMSVVECWDKVTISDYLEQNPQAREIYALWVKDIDAMIKSVNNEQLEKADKLSADLKQQSKKQTALAKNIAAASPYSCFLYIATDITGTGLHNIAYVETQMSEQSDIFYKYLEHKFQETVKQDPAFSYESYLDISDRPPIYVHKEEPITTKLAATLPYWLILIAFNALFIALAYVRFMRYDVR